MYPPKYKYPNSKRISRTTLEGYWKPTGNTRKIINPDTGEEIGSKKTLVFYKGQCNDKNRNKTCWVMHEYELKVVPKATHPDQHPIKTFNLCKLKKKADISSSDEAGQSSQHYLSNLENYVANNAMFEDLLDPNGSSEPEASNDSGVVHNQSRSLGTYAGERSNQHNVVNEDEGSNLSSNLIHHVAEDAIPKEPLHLKEVSTERKESNDNNWVQNLHIIIEQDDQYCNSIITNNDESVPIERSNQHNMVVAAEGFKVPSNLENLDDGDLIPTHLLYNDELLAELEATNNSNWIQNQYVTNIEDDSGVVHNQSSSLGTYAGERSNQHNVVNEDEGSNVSSNLIHHVAEDAIPKEPLHLKEVSTERNGSNDNNWVQNLYSIIEQDDQYCISIITSDDESVPIERSNQHNMVVVAEGFKVPSNLENLDDGDLIPTDLLYNDELLELEATNNSNWIQNQYVTNIEDGGFLNSSFANNNEVYLQEENTEQCFLQEENTEQCLAADNEGFSLPCLGVMESSNSMEKSRKRSRLQYDGLSHHVDIGEAKPWGEEYPSSSKSIQANSYDRMVTPRIGGSITYQ
ncbi:hypothetical protein REPUB_Repub17cG0057500 [Reevesia pubescens]